MHWIQHSTPPTLDTDLSDSEITTRLLNERRENGDRPWIYSNMVASLDGASAVDGKSGELGGAGDAMIFSTLRAVADVIVAGAQTVRAEQYRLPRMPTEAKATWRAAHGLAPRPRLCIVTRQPRLSDFGRLLDDLDTADTTDPTSRPIIATVDSAADLDDDRFDLVRLGDDGVDPSRLTTHLHSLGMTRILCEGGPRLLAQFHSAGLVDEWNFTIAAAVVSGDAARALAGEDELVANVCPTRTIFHNDGTYFVRALRR